MTAINITNAYSTFLKNSKAVNHCGTNHLTQRAWQYSQFNKKKLQSASINYVTCAMLPRLKKEHFYPVTKNSNLDLDLDKVKVNQYT